MAGDKKTKKVTGPPKLSSSSPPTMDKSSKLSTPNLSKPNLSTPKLSTPKLSTPNLSKPNLSAPNLSTPKLSKSGVITETKSKSNKNLSSSNKKGSSKPIRKKYSVQPSVYLKNWRREYRQIHSSLLSLFSMEMKIRVHLTPINDILKQFIIKLMKGQVEYFNEMIEQINSGKDDISKELMKKDPSLRASTQVFQSLKSYVLHEIKLFEEDKEVKPMEFIEEDLLRFKDKRIDTRGGFWLLLLLGLMLDNTRKRFTKEFDIMMPLLIKYPPIYKKSLAVILHLAYFLIRDIEPFPLDDSRVKLIPNPTNTGYNMGHWIKYRYGTNIQEYIDYEEFIEYFARSFGLVRGRAPEFKRKAYQNWIDRALQSLEKYMRTCDYLVERAKGDTLEGIIAGMIEEVEKELNKREYDDHGKLINQPPECDKIYDFLSWLLELSLNRHKTINMAMQDPRLTYSMFKFIPYTIRWINEYGERIPHQWFPDEEENN